MKCQTIQDMTNFREAKVPGVDYEPEPMPTPLEVIEENEIDSETRPQQEGPPEEDKPHPPSGDYEEGPPPSDGSPETPPPEYPEHTNEDTPPYQPNREDFQRINSDSDHNKESHPNEDPSHNQYHDIIRNNQNIPHNNDNERSEYENRGTDPLPPMSPSPYQDSPNLMNNHRNDGSYGDQHSGTLPHSHPNEEDTDRNDEPYGPYPSHNHPNEDPNHSDNPPNVERNNYNQQNPRSPVTPDLNRDPNIEYTPETPPPETPYYPKESDDGPIERQDVEYNQNDSPLEPHSLVEPINDPALKQDDIPKYEIKPEVGSQGDHILKYYEQQSKVDSSRDIPRIAKSSSNKINFEQKIRNEQNMFDNNNNNNNNTKDSQIIDENKRNSRRISLSPNPHSEEKGYLLPIVGELPARQHHYKPTTGARIYSKSQEYHSYEPNPSASDEDMPNDELHTFYDKWAEEHIKYAQQKKDELDPHEQGHSKGHLKGHSEGHSKGYSKDHLNDHLKQDINRNAHKRSGLIRDGHQRYHKNRNNYMKDDSNRDDSHREHTRDHTHPDQTEAIPDSEDYESSRPRNDRLSHSTENTGEDNAHHSHSHSHSRPHHHHHHHHRHRRTHPHHHDRHDHDHDHHHHPHTHSPNHQKEPQYEAESEEPESHSHDSDELPEQKPQSNERPLHYRRYPAKRLNPTENEENDYHRHNTSPERGPNSEAISEENPKSNDNFEFDFPQKDLSDEKQTTGKLGTFSQLPFNFESLIATDPSFLDALTPHQNLNGTTDYYQDYDNQNDQEMTEPENQEQFRSEQQTHQSPTPSDIEEEERQEYKPQRKRQRSSHSVDSSDSRHSHPSHPSQPSHSSHLYNSDKTSNEYNNQNNDFSQNSDYYRENAEPRGRPPKERSGDNQRTNGDYYSDNDYRQTNQNQYSRQHEEPQVMPYSGHKGRQHYYDEEKAATADISAQKVDPKSGLLLSDETKNNLTQNNSSVDSKNDNKTIAIKSIGSFSSWTKPLILKTRVIVVDERNDTKVLENNENGFEITNKEKRFKAKPVVDRNQKKLRNITRKPKTENQIKEKNVINLSDISNKSQIYDTIVNPNNKSEYELRLNNTKPINQQLVRYIRTRPQRSISNDIINSLRNSIHSNDNQLLDISENILGKNWENILSSLSTNRSLEISDVQQIQPKCSEMTPIKDFCVESDDEYPL